MEVGVASADLPIPQMIDMPINVDIDHVLLFVPACYVASNLRTNGDVVCPFCMTEYCEILVPPIIAIPNKFIDEPKRIDVIDM